MATLSWPGFALASISPTLDQPSQSNSSGWTGTRTVITNPWHGKWSFKVTLATRQGDAAFQAARAFFTSLKGQINTFHLPAVEAPQNGNTGVTLSANAAQGATSIVLTGVTTALVAGNMVTIAGQLLSLTSVGSLSGTAQTLNFQPSLRAAASSGASVETAKPYALVYLSDSSFTWDIGQWRRYGLTFNAAEAVGETDGADPALDVWTGGVGSGGGGGGTSFSFPQLPSFVSRGLLAAVVSPTDKQVAYLTEAGREGVFIFSTTNLSGSVTADPHQGRYVAPASDTSGASGAWVRNHSPATVSSEPVTVAQQFYEATDSSFGQAIQRALDHLRATGINGGLVDAYRGSVPLRVPAGDYTTNIPIDIYHSVDVFGDGSGDGGPAPAKGCTHIHGVGTGIFRLQAATTYGDNSVDVAATHPGCGRARLRGFMLTSDSPTDRTKHAVIMRTISDVWDIYARDFGGLAVRCWTGNFRGTNYAGQTSTSTIQRVKGEGCQGTFSIGGTDSNLIQTDGCQGYQNQQFGGEDSNAAGANKHRGFHATFNGMVPPAAGPFVGCSQSGNIYVPNFSCVDFTNPTATSTLLNAHAPSGTTAHTAYWIYNGPGGPATATPAYASGGPWIYGGDMLSMSPYATEWDSCYNEGGGLINQSLYLQPVWNGGTVDHSQLYGGTLLKSTDNAFEIIRSGATVLTLRSGGGSVSFEARDYASVLYWLINAIQGGSTEYWTPSSHHFYTQDGASLHDVGELNYFGLMLAASRSVYIGGTEVLNGQMAAIADLGAAPTMADFNGLLAKLRGVKLLHA